MFYGYSELYFKGDSFLVDIIWIYGYMFYDMLCYLILVFNNKVI